MPAVASTYLIIFDNDGGVWFNGMLDSTTVFIDELPTCEEILEQH